MDYHHCRFLSRFSTFSAQCLEIIRQSVEGVFRQSPRKHGNRIGFVLISCRSVSWYDLIGLAFDDISRATIASAHWEIPSAGSKYRSPGVPPLMRHWRGKCFPRTRAAIVPVRMPSAEDRSWTMNILAVPGEFIDQVVGEERSPPRFQRIGFQGW
jgi:hypothetical protein